MLEVEEPCGAGVLVFVGRGRELIEVSHLVFVNPAAELFVLEVVI